MPFFKNSGPSSRITMLKSFSRMIPAPRLTDTSLSFAVIELLKEAKAPPLLIAAPTSPGIAAERLRVAPSRTTAESMSSTGFPSRKIVVILCKTYSSSRPSCSQRSALTLHPTEAPRKNPVWRNRKNNERNLRLTFIVRHRNPGPDGCGKGLVCCNFTS